MSEGIRRVSRVREGYDCRSGVCERPKVHRPSPHGTGCGGYGIRNDDWWYAVADDARGVALSLLVYSENVRGKEQAHKRGYLMVAGLAVHPAYPTDRESVRRGTTPSDCEFLSAGKCFSFSPDDISTEKALQALLIEDFKQTDQFWAEFERCFEKAAKEAEAERADTRWQRCQHCDATGLLRKED